MKEIFGDAYDSMQKPPTTDEHVHPDTSIPSGLITPSSTNLPDYEFEARRRQPGDPLYLHPTALRPHPPTLLRLLLSQKTSADFLSIHEFPLRFPAVPCSFDEPWLRTHTRIIARYRHWRKSKNMWMTRSVGPGFLESPPGSNRTYGTLSMTRQAHIKSVWMYCAMIGIF
jgi:hypothetical protein